ncbi:MAG: hypothetical protein MK132_08385 [Lentisphaerales bacterium]|nr:hypothetical protein [Lentisphaerales bacterium]
MKKFLCCFMTVLVLSLPVSAADMESRMKRMEKMLQKMQSELKAKDSKIEKLEKKVTILNEQKKQKDLKKLSDDQVLDELTKDNHNKSVSYQTRKNSSVKGKMLTLGKDVNSFLETLNISSVINVVAGTSSVRDSDLEMYQGGGHDPKKRGFSMQSMELAISGTVDDLFDAQSYILFTEDEVELEEAYITTRSLPANLQLKAGYFLTEFGIVNQEHAHSWDFMDQPIISTRIFGGEGMKDAGVRLSWLAPTPWYSELLVGVQNSDGDGMVSYRGEGHVHGEDEHGDEDHEHEFEEGVAGRPYEDGETETLSDMVWLARWVNSFNVSQDSTLQLGVSNLYGDNHTGGETWIYGADAKYVIEDKELGRADWVFQGEIMKRQYKANSFLIEEDDPADNIYVPSDEVDDWGFYVQALKAIDKKWSVGLRYEYVSGSGDSFEGEEFIDREEDFERSDRVRISPLVVYQHSEFTKMRLQYNFDDSDTEGEANTLWLGVEVILGSHPAHKF